MATYIHCEMSEMQKRFTHESRKNTSQRAKTTLVLLAVSSLLCLAIVEQADALKITVKFKYPSELKEHPKQIGKIYLNAYSSEDE